LFRDRPTGFAIFPVGRAETTCLLILQKLAAVGPELERRKLVVSLSPPYFFERLMARADGYAGNFSPLHAGEFTFNTRLSLQLRQDAARRMLQYPATVVNRPLLKFALENLSEGSPLSLACYGALFPLAIVHNAILRYQDHWRVVNYLWQHPEMTSPPKSSRRASPLDWPRLQRQADEVYRAQCNNNALGPDNDKWISDLRRELLRKTNTHSDETFLRTLHGNQEWVDLDLLLRELKEFGVQPLLLSMPINGGWYDQLGVTSSARRAYYQQLREVSARHHTALVDFADHDSDQTFCRDILGHPTPRALVYYNQALDGFFHGAVIRPSPLPALAPVPCSGTEPDLPPRPAR
jgi:D-alanine transfer protein